MDPISLSVGAMAVGSLASAKAKKMEGDAQAAAALQDALAMNQDAAATRIDAVGLRQDAEATRLSATLLEDQAKASDYNAQLNLQNAEQFRLQYAENERRLRVKQAKERGAIRAGFGSSGLQITGSALDVLAEAAATHELDALTIRHEGEVKAIAEENDAKLNRFSAASSRRNAAGVMEKAAYIDERASFSDQQASFLDERADFVRSTAPKLKKAGNLRAVGELASGASTLIGKMRG